MCQARKLMIFLYGSEADAIAVSDAVMRYATPEEEALIRQRSKEDNEIALQTIRKHGLVPEAVPSDDSIESELTEEQEREFASFMEGVYRRAEEQSIREEEARGIFRPIDTEEREEDGS